MRGSKSKGKRGKGGGRSQKTEYQVETNNPKQNKEKKQDYANPLVIMTRELKYIIIKRKERKGKWTKHGKCPHGVIESEKCEENP